MLYTDELGAVADPERHNLHLVGLPTYTSLLSVSPPKLVWHYTSPAGLQGIVKSRSLHATDINFLNDRLEVRYGLGRVAEVIREMGSHTFAETMGKHFQNLLDLPAERRHGLQPRGVASFCAQGDLLSQWRGYGEFGQGCSIGFDSGCFASEQHEWVFVPVVYDSARQLALIREVVEYGCRVCDYEHLKPGAEMAALGHAVSNQLFFFSHFFKSGAFSEESEWRFLQGPMTLSPDWSTPAAGNCEFRISKAGILVPYYSIDLAKIQGSTSIREVQLGPGIPANPGELGVHYLLSQYMPTPTPTVRTSGIPFSAR